MGRLRDLRKTVLAALEADPWPDGLASLEDVRPKTLLGPLYACLLEPDERVRWRAATAFGRTVARLFAEKPEDARQLLRQFMWRLNEESGNIAWGIPEAFGEILAAQPVLAGEFHRVLASYINDRDCATGDNYLELCPLRRGVYWALGRLAEASPLLVLPALSDLLLAFKGEDPQSRGLAAWAVGSLLPHAGENYGLARTALEALASGETGNYTFDFYRGGELSCVSVGQLAREGIEKAA
ncbi:MAG: DVU0298 family protein [Acidobacteriota bacterium]